MVKNHLKSLSVPRTWPIERKHQVFLTRPNSGAHSYSVAMPITVILRDILKIAETAKEVSFMLTNGQILVDQKARKDKKYMMGLMDTLSIPAENKHYRMILSNYGKLDLIEIKEEESKFKPSKIKNKNYLKGKKIQLNLADGRNILVQKDDYKTEDSILIELPSQKISKVLPLEKNAYVFLIGGKHLGKHGKIEEIQNEHIVFKSDKILIKTLKDYALVIGENKPEITV